MPAECNTEVLDFPVATVEDLISARAVYCPDFQQPCPEVVLTILGDLLFGSTFRIEFSTSIGVTEKYRQREVVGGVPGAWSGFLFFTPDTFPVHTTEDTFHPLSEHRFSNKAANSLWQYQLLLSFNGGTKSEFWPDCGNSVIQVQYPPKNDPGGGIPPVYDQPL